MERRERIANDKIYTDGIFHKLNESVTEMNLVRGGEEAVN